MKKILITGATGFIGYHLVKTLWKNSIEIWAVCRESNKDIDKIKKIPGIHVISCDLNDISKLPVLCTERGFDIFYHIAWDGTTGFFRDDANLQLQNVNWTIDCVKVAHLMGCKKIICTGTICENQYDAIVDCQEYINISSYLIAKRYSRVMAFNMGKKYNQNVIWCTFYHPIGIYNKREQIIAHTIQSILRKESVSFGSGNGLFDIIDVSDLARALYIMGNVTLAKNIYFVGSGNPLRLKEYLQIVKREIDNKAVLNFGKLPLPELPMKREWLDTTDFCTETGFRPLINFINSIHAMEKWMLNIDKYETNKWNYRKW